MFRALAITLAVVATICWLGPKADACEMCRRFGSTAYHVEALGGDDPADAFSPPRAPTGGEESEGEGQFSASSNKWPQPGGKGSLVTVTYSYNNLLDGGLKDHNGVSLPTSLIKGSIEEALGLWASVAPLKFVEVPDEGLAITSPYQYPSGQFGQIRFHHVYYNGPDPAVGDPIAKAFAYYPSSSGTLPGDVFFDHSDPWQEVGSLHEPDVLGAAIHELGHALGLNHTSVSTANMYWIFTRYSGLGTGVLHPDDIAGIQSIYGAGKGKVVPLSMHTPEPASATLAWAAALLLWPLVRGLRRR